MTEQFTLKAEPVEIRRASSWLEHLCAEHKIPQEQCLKLDLCLNESLANILDHGGEVALTEPIFLEFNIDKHGIFTEAGIVVSDAGQKFDPLSMAPKAMPQSLAEAEIGGLGLVMLKNLSDDFGYCYKDGRNHLKFTVRWPV